MENQITHDNFPLQINYVHPGLGVRVFTLNEEIPLRVENGKVEAYYETPVTKTVDIAGSGAYVDLKQAREKAIR